MKKLLSFLCFLFLLEGVYAQQYNGCGFKIPKKKPQTGNSFASTYEARSHINRILNAVNWKANFEVQELPYGTNNAYASYKNGRRYIEYDNSFCESIDWDAGTKWASISILAHEIGHHYYDHVFDGVGSTPPKEIDADFFSGFAMAKLGASLEQAKAAMQEIASPYEGSTHPARDRRLAAIEKGWCKAKDCGNTETKNEDWIYLHNPNDLSVAVELSDDGINYETVRINANDKFVFKYEIYNYGWIKVKSQNGTVMSYTLQHGKKYKVEYNNAKKCWDVFNY